MNHLDVRQNTFAACGETMQAFVSNNRKATVVCPKPRRAGVLINNPARPLRCDEAELLESRERADLLDMILAKEGNVTEPPIIRIASPPQPRFFAGSPPSRTNNPLIYDAQFGNEKVTSPLSPLTPSSPSALTRCVRSNFGLTPAAVRIEGFDCLNRDQHSRIPAIA